MKIRLDTEKKTIQIEDNVLLGELFKTLKKLIPNDEWKEFRIEPMVIDNTIFFNPVYVQPEPVTLPIFIPSPEYPVYPVY